MEQATLVERILAKVVGNELSAEEMELISGGQRPECVGGGVYTQIPAGCDDAV